MKNEAINYIKEIINDVGLPIESLKDLMNFLETKTEIGIARA